MASDSIRSSPVTKSLRMATSTFGGIGRQIKSGVGLMWGDFLSRIALLYLVGVTILAIVGPYIIPYGFLEIQYAADGTPLIAAPPSLSHPLGTTGSGYDVMSRLMYGARPTLIAGFTSGALLITIGTTVGSVAGYVGGTVENVLMRITDFWYAVPLLPFAIIFIAYFSIGYWGSIFVIAFILWRGSARVIRSQVLQIKERPFITAARTTGGSTPYIIVKHILPNIATMVILFLALGIGSSILAFAGLAFLGITNPFVPSWGVMIRNAYDSGQMAETIWWSLPPGFMLSFTVLAAYVLGRRYETVTSDLGEGESIRGAW